MITINMFLSAAYKHSWTQPKMPHHYLTRECCFHNLLIRLLHILFPNSYIPLYPGKTRLTLGLLLPSPKTG